MNKKFLKYLWVVLPMVVWLLLWPMFGRQHPSTSSAIKELQKIPKIIRIDLPESPEYCALTTLKTDDCDQATGNVYNRVEQEQPTLIETLYLDLSPEDHRLLFTLYSVTGDSVTSGSPHRQGNETIVDYILDPAPQPWGQNGIKRYYFKYTVTPGQKVSPDMTKILPGETGLAYMTNAFETSVACTEFNNLLHSDHIPFSCGQLSEKFEMDLYCLYNHDGSIASAANIPGNQVKFANAAMFDYYTIMAIRQISFAGVAEKFLLVVYQSQRPWQLSLFLLGDQGSIIKLRGFDGMAPDPIIGQLGSVEVLKGNRYLLAEGKSIRFGNSPEPGGHVFLLDLSQFTPDHKKVTLTEQELRRDPEITATVCGKPDCPIEKLGIKNFRIISNAKKNRYFLVFDLIASAKQAATLDVTACRFCCDVLTNFGSFDITTRAHYPVSLQTQSPCLLAPGKETVIPLITSAMMPMFSRGGEYWVLWGKINPAKNNHCDCKFRIEFYH